MSRLRVGPVVSWIALVLVIIALALGVGWIYGTCTANNDFTPVRLVEFRIEPEILTTDGPGTLHNGVCLDSDGPQLVEVFLGLERVPHGDPIVEGEVLPLVGAGDTPEGRERRTLSPGCVDSEAPVAFTVPTTIPPGHYRLYVHLIATSEDGRTQNLIERSNEFEIRAGEK